jgi:uncharacterized protein (DUF302 family)
MVAGAGTVSIVISSGGIGMVRQTTRYGFGVTVAMPVDLAVERVKTSLAEEGFGVLSEIDMAATLKKKLDVDIPPYVILGACNPPLARQALDLEQDIGLLLPCNVVVYAATEEGSSVVAAMDPEEALRLTGNDAIGPIAGEVKVRLQRALSRLAG